MASRNRPTIVFATAAAFFPPLQGDAGRIWSFVEFFRSHGWRVCVVHWHSPDQTYADYAAMEERCDSLEIFEAEPRPLLTGTSARCDDWCPAAFAELVGARCRAEGAKTLVAQFAFLSRCLAEDLPPSTVRVLDADNVFSGRAEVFRRNGFSYDWFSTDEVEEARALRRADIVLAIQEQEARALRRLAPHARVIVVSHARSAVDLCDVGDGILFVGAANQVNAAGITEFVDALEPRLAARAPSTRIMIAGGVCDLIGGLGERVERVGRVADLEPLYRDAAVAVNPATCGTGLKIKTVEALCHGKALVTTVAGAAGLERFAHAFRRATGTGALAEAAVSLLVDDDARRRLGHTAYLFARRYFAPERVLTRFERELLQHAAASSRGT
jgi:hypothetical protein